MTLIPTTGLNSPQGMRFDAADNLYVCDASNGRIVVVTPAGVQTTLAMTGLQQPRYLAFDAGYANLYVSDRYAGILQYNLSSGKTAVYATNLFKPEGIALDAQNNVYYGDGGTLVKNKISFSTSVGEPDGLIFDKEGNLYIEGSALYRMDPSGAILRLADDGANDIAIDSHGLLYMPAYNEQHMLVYIAGPAVWGGRNNAFVGRRVSNQYANSIRTYYTTPVGVTLSSLTIPTADSPYGGDKSPSCATSTLCGANLSLGTFLPGPQPGYGVATFSDGTKVNTPLYGSGVQVEIGFSPGVASQTTTGVTQYGGAANDLNGSVYVSDSAANKVLKVTGITVTRLGFVGLNAPTQLALDGTGTVYVLHSGSQRILKLDSSGKQTVVFDLAQQAATLPTLASVQSFTVDGATNLFLGGLTTAKTAVIESYGANGVNLIYATAPSISTVLAFDTDGTLYAAEAQGTLVKYDHFANRLQVATGVPAAGSIAIEPSGTVYLANSTSSALTQVPPTGSATTYQVPGVKLASVVTADNYGNLSVGDNSTQLLSLNDRTTQPYGFGDVTVGTSSTLHRSLVNVGSQDGLTISSISGGGPFVVDSGTTTCVPGTTSLVAGGSCEIGLTFTPTAVSSYSSTGQVAIPLPTPSYSATVANLALTGVGVKEGPIAKAGGPYSGTTGSAVSFSGLASSDPGNEALTYAWSFGDNSSGTGATPSHTYAAAGTYTVTLTATNADGATASATATATIAQSYTATLTPGASDFGSVAIGSSQTRAFTLTNTSATAMSVGGVAISASVFTLASQTCGTTLAAGVSCTYTIAYTPTATGAASATFSVMYTAGTQSSALTATGLPAGALTITPTVQQFPATAAGATVAMQTSTISNTTAQAIYLSSGSLTNATDFAQTDNCNGLIAVGGTCTVSFSFIPKTTGVLTSTYNIHNLNTPASVLSVALSGTATGAPMATFNPGSVTIGTTSAAQVFTLSNTGNAALPITSIAVAGSTFALTANTCGTSLAAAASCTVSITFAPSSVGTAAGTLTVVDVVGTQTSALIGTGNSTMTADFSVSATPAAQTSYRGGNVAYALQLASLRAAAPFNKPVVLSAANLPAGVTASFSPASVLPGTAQATSVMTLSIPAIVGQSVPLQSRSASGAIYFSALLVGLFWLKRGKRRSRMLRPIPQKHCSPRS